MYIYIGIYLYKYTYYPPAPLWCIRLRRSFVYISHFPLSEVTVNCHAVLCHCLQVIRQQTADNIYWTVPSMNGSRHGGSQKIPWRKVLLPVWLASKPFKQMVWASSVPQTLENITPNQLWAFKRHHADIVCKHPQATLMNKWPRTAQMRLTPQLGRFSTFGNWCKKIIKFMTRGDCV